MNLLNNKYYVNGKLSLSKALGFLNEDTSTTNSGVANAGNADAEAIQQFADNTNNDIKQITINVGYIPCYNFKNFTAVAARELEDNFLADMNKIKEHYATLENENAADGMKNYVEAFGYLMLLSNFDNITASSTADTTLIAQQSEFSKKMATQLGNDVKNQLIKKAFGLMNIAINSNPQPSIPFTDDEKKRILRWLNDNWLSEIPTFDACLGEQTEEQPEEQSSEQPEEQSSEQPEEQSSEQPEAKDLSVWYRFPQLNGGFFEMADSLLNSNKMQAIQKTNRKYKQYEKQGTMYGLIDSNGNADTNSAETIIDFFQRDGWKGYLSAVTILDSQKTAEIGKILNSFTKRELGRILDEFFKNRMVKVGEYYLLDTSFFMYCILIALQKAGIDVKNQLNDLYTTTVTNRSPKIIKAKFAPTDLPDAKDVRNSAVNIEKISPQKLTIKQMFKGRADKNFANSYGASSEESKNNYLDSAHKNMVRSNRERIYR